VALIRSFERKATDRKSLHDEIRAEYSIQEWDGRVLLQIDTYGRATREFPDKLSQTIQLDREGAEALYLILKREFGFE
jgi:hypothetical protein